MSSATSRPRRRSPPGPGEIDDDVADWFAGTSADEVAAAVKAVEREAAASIEDQDAARLAAFRGRSEIAAPSRPGLPQGLEQQPYQQTPPGYAGPPPMPADYDGPGTGEDEPPPSGGPYQPPNYPPPGQR